MQINANSASTAASTDAGASSKKGTGLVDGQFKTLLELNPDATAITKESDPEAWNAWNDLEDRRMQVEIQAAQSQIRSYNNMLNYISGHQELIADVQAHSSESTVEDNQSRIASAQKYISQAESWIANHSLNSLYDNLNELTAKYAAQKAKWAVEE